MLCIKTIAESTTLQKTSSDGNHVTNVTVAVSKMYQLLIKKEMMVAHSHPSLKNEGRILVTICEE